MTSSIVELSLPALVFTDGRRKKELTERSFICVLVKESYEHRCLDGPYYVIPGDFHDSKKLVLRGYRWFTTDWSKPVTPRVDLTEHFSVLKRCDLVPVTRRVTDEELNSIIDEYENTPDLNIIRAEHESLEKQAEDLDNKASKLWHNYLNKRREAMMRKLGLLSD